MTFLDAHVAWISAVVMICALALIGWVLAVWSQR